MAKNLNNWHKKHIPSKWGIAILGFLTVSVVLLIPILQKSQNAQTLAASNSSDPIRILDCLKNNNSTLCRGNLYYAKVNCQTGSQYTCYSDLNPRCAYRSFSQSLKNALCSNYSPPTACAQAGGWCTTSSNSGVGFCGNPNTPSAQRKSNVVQKGYTLTTSYKCANNYQICCKKK